MFFFKLLFLDPNAWCAVTAIAITIFHRQLSHLHMIFGREKLIESSLYLLQILLRLESSRWKIIVAGIVQQAHNLPLPFSSGHIFPS